MDANEEQLPLRTECGLMDAKLLSQWTACHSMDQYTHITNAHGGSAHDYSPSCGAADLDDGASTRVLSRMAGQRLFLDTHG